MRVAILGCGYVGIALGRRLACAGHDPIGVRRSSSGMQAIEEAGFRAVGADVTDPEALADVPDVDAVVFAASSGGRDAEAARKIYVDGLRGVIDHFADSDRTPERLLYTSSTGVYGDHGGDWVDETTPTTPTTAKTQVLADAESIAIERAERAGMEPTVVRLAGLYGPERYRIDRYLNGPVTEGWSNLLHRDDAAGICQFLLERTEPPEIVLAVDDEPVSKWALADWLATATGNPRPPKRTRHDRLQSGDHDERTRRRLRTSKRCCNDRLRHMGYRFAHPTFRSGYDAAIRDRRRGEEDP
jgi:nucleoside-diphosphate-sugar epimerase